MLFIVDLSSLAVVIKSRSGPQIYNAIARTRLPSCSARWAGSLSTCFQAQFAAMPTLSTSKSSSCTKRSSRRRYRCSHTLSRDGGAVMALVSFRSVWAGRRPIQCGVPLWDLQLCYHHFNDLHMMFVNPNDVLEFLMHGQAGSLSATGICGAGQVTPLVDSGKCNGQPLAQPVEVLACRRWVGAFRLCAALWSLAERKWFYSDTVSKSAASCLSSWQFSLQKRR